MCPKPLTAGRNSSTLMGLTDSTAPISLEGGRTMTSWSYLPSGVLMHESSRCWELPTAPAAVLEDAYSEEDMCAVAVAVVVTVPWIIGPPGRDEKVHREAYSHMTTKHTHSFTPSNMHECIQTYTYTYSYICIHTRIYSQTNERKNAHIHTHAQKTWTKTNTNT